MKEMQNAVNMTFDVIEPLKSNSKKEISEKEMEARLEVLAPKYDEVISKLTPQQKSYIQRLSQACSYNFLYAED